MIIAFYSFWSMYTLHSWLKIAKNVKNNNKKREKLVDTLNITCHFIDIYFTYTNFLFFSSKAFNNNLIFNCNFGVVSVMEVNGKFSRGTVN